MAVDDEFGERDPAQEVHADGRQLNDKGEVCEVKFGHSDGSNKNGAGPLPVQARLKSSAVENSIGHVARSMGLRPSAVRYYESQGLLPPLPRAGGKRVLTASAVSRLKLIVEARKLGLGMKALRSLSEAGPDEWRKEARKVTCQLQAEIAGISARISRLTALSQCACSSDRDCALG